MTEEETNTSISSTTIIITINLWESRRNYKCRYCWSLRSLVRSEVEGRGSRRSENKKLKEKVQKKARSVSNVCSKSWELGALLSDTVNIAG